MTERQKHFTMCCKFNSDIRQTAGAPFIAFTKYLLGIAEFADK